MSELTPAQRRARIRAYVSACETYGYPEGCCTACGEPWSIHPLWCAECPEEEEEEPLLALMAGVMGLALISTLVAPGAPTGDIFQVIRDNLAFLTQEGGPVTIIDGGDLDNQDDGGDYFRGLDRYDDAPAHIPQQALTAVIVEQFEAGAGEMVAGKMVDPPPFTMTVVGLRAGGPPISLEIDRRARYVSLQIPAPDDRMRPAPPAGGVQGREATGVVPSPMEGSATDQSAG